MSMVIAVSGKGGVGKTTVAALVVRAAIEQGRGPVLAVDADPNWNLGTLLGAEPERTIADVREDALERRLKTAAGMSRQRQIEHAIQCTVLEGKSYDLVTMGRPEGPKCYCYVNHLLRSYMDTATGSYRLVVVDNEAGMEHLSRRTTNDVDRLWIVAEPTVVGLRTVRRIAEIAGELSIRVGRMGLLLNRTGPGGLDPSVEGVMEGLDIEVLARIPMDERLAALSVRGDSIFSLSRESVALVAVSGVLADVFDSD